MPRARSLYGSLPDQLRDRHSFANGLRRLLRLRSKYGIASARQIDVPDVAHPGMLVLVHELEQEDVDGQPTVQITVLNMTGAEVDGTVRSETLPLRATVVDAANGAELGVVDDLASFPIKVPAYGARFLILRRAL